MRTTKSCEEFIKAFTKLLIVALLPLIAVESFAANRADSVKKITLTMGDGLNENHVYNYTQNTHTVEYIAIGKEKFTFNDNNLLELHQAVEKKYFDEPIVWRYQDLGFSNYRKQVYSIDKGILHFDSFPLVSRTISSSVGYKSELVIDLRKRKLTAIVDSLRPQLRKKYDLSGGVIKYTYVDSFKAMNLYLNANTRDTLYLSTKQQIKMEGKKEKVVKTYFFYGSVLYSMGEIHKGTHIWPPLMQESIYDDSVLVSDELSMIIKGKKHQLMKDEFIDDFTEKYTLINPLHDLHPTDTFIKKLSLTSDTILSFEIRRGNYNRISERDLLLSDTLSEYYLGYKVARDYLVVKGQFNNFRYERLNSTVFERSAHRLPYDYDSSYKNYNYIGFFIDQVRGIELGYINFKLGFEPYGSGLRAMEYAELTEMFDYQSSYNSVLNRIEIKDSNNVKYLANWWFRNRGGKLINIKRESSQLMIDYYSDLIFPKGMKSNQKRSITEDLIHLTLNKDFYTRRRPVYSRLNFQYSGELFEFESIFRRDVDIYDSLWIEKEKFSGVTKYTDIERPNQRSICHFFRWKNFHDIERIFTVKYNRIQVDNKIDFYDYYRFKIYNENGKDYSIKRGFYNYIPGFYPYFKMEETASWNGFQKCDDDLSAHEISDVPPFKYYKEGKENDKKITETRKGDTLYLTESTGKIQYSAVMINGLVHSITYKNNGKTYRLLYWEKKNGVNKLINTYDTYPPEIKSLLKFKSYKFESKADEIYNCQILQKYALIHYLYPNLRIE